MLTNLEAVDLSFRLRFVTPVLWDHPSALDRLRNCIGPLGEEVMSTGISGIRGWRQIGSSYEASWMQRVPAGLTRRAGLKAHKPTASAFGGDYLRGYWELTLPALSATARQPPRPQLDRPARVLISVFRRAHRRVDDRIVSDHKEAFPLVSGKVEHFIPAEKEAVSPDPAIAVATRAAKSRARAASRRTAKRRR
jgi:hypothetical protein